MVRGVVVGAVCVGLVLTGCGSDDPPGAAPTNPAGAAPPEGSGNGAGAEECPLTEAELASATSLSWQMGTTKRDHPLETMESVKVTACVFTAPDKQGMGGDPLVLRVDVVGARDAGAVRDNFASTCADLGGTQREAGSGTVCDRNGSVVEGYTGNLVMVYLVNADRGTAASLSPSFDKLLAAAS
jgi:hypothetical protein